MNNIEKLVMLVTTTQLGYNEQAKAEFHRLAKSVARAIAQELQLPLGSYQIRSNMGGIAVSGEVTLHARNLYVQFGQSSLQSLRESFMYRHCNGLQDYTGGTNRWFKWTELVTRFDFVLTAFKATQNCVEGMRPERFTQGQIEQGGGFASYAKVNGKWYSVNGGPSQITDVRWQVTNLHVIADLERRTQ